MLADAQQYAARAPWTAVVPGLAIMLVALAFNLFGDALRDALDPRSSR
jgi:peptide/nickel transport system permease protein